MKRSIAIVYSLAAALVERLTESGLMSALPLKIDAAAAKSTRIIETFD